MRRFNPGPSAIAMGLLLISSSAFGQFSGYFSGYYAPENWTRYVYNNPAYQDTAYVNTGTTPNSLGIVGAVNSQQQASGPQVPVSIIDYTIVLSGTGLQPVAFNYAFLGLLDGGYDSAALIYEKGNGMKVVTSLSALLDGTQQSYFNNTTFQGGHAFGFRVYSNNDSIPDTLRISAVPEPSVLTCLSIGVGALSWRLRRRQS